MCGRPEKVLRSLSHSISVMPSHSHSERGRSITHFFLSVFLPGGSSTFNLLAHVHIPTLEKERGRQCWYWIVQKKCPHLSFPASVALSADQPMRSQSAKMLQLNLASFFSLNPVVRTIGDIESCHTFIPSSLSGVSCVFTFTHFRRRPPPVRPPARLSYVHSSMHSFGNC